MASSTSAAVLMATPLTSANQKKILGSSSFLKSLPITNPSRAAQPITSSSKVNSRIQVKASLKEKAVAGMTAAATTAYMVMIPEVAEAAGSGVSPSLKNFLLSIVAGGVVLGAIIGAIIGVSNFDPVKRN